MTLRMDVLLVVGRSCILAPYHSMVIPTLLWGAEHPFLSSEANPL